MSFLLDTDWTIDFLGGRPAAQALVARLLHQDLAISIVTYMEVLEGIRGRPGSKRRERDFRRFLKSIRVITIGRPIAVQAADIRVDLRQRKRPVDERALDILIAATAIERNLILATRNTRHYEDIPSLRLYEEVNQ
ncbi:MAG: type II toxin-antitoxin system VapC family toxin [Thermomicrobiales bacterium]